MDKVMFLNSWSIMDQEGNTRFIPQFQLWRIFIHAIGFCAVVVVLAKWGTGLEEWRDVITDENGPVERMSAAVWLMGFVWTFVAAWCDKPCRVEWLLVSTFLLLFGLRELDAHRWATGWNLDKLANYWNPEFPFVEKLIVVGCMVLPCSMVGVILWRRLWQTIGPAWMSGESWLGHLTVVIILLVVCLTLDKIGPYFLPFLGMGNVGQITLMFLEEFLEMALAVFTLVSLWPYLFKAFYGDV